MSQSLQVRGFILFFALFLILGAEARASVEIPKAKSREGLVLLSPMQESFEQRNQVHVSQLGRVHQLTFAPANKPNREKNKAPLQRLKFEYIEAPQDMQKQMDSYLKLIADTFPKELVNPFGFQSSKLQITNNEVGIALANPKETAIAFLQATGTPMDPQSIHIGAGDESATLIAYLEKKALVLIVLNPDILGRTEGSVELFVRLAHEIMGHLSFLLKEGTPGLSYANQEVRAYRIILAWLKGLIRVLKEGSSSSGSRFPSDILPAMEKVYKLHEEELKRFEKLAAAEKAKQK